MIIIITSVGGVGSHLDTLVLLAVRQTAQCPRASLEAVGVFLTTMGGSGVARSSSRKRLGIP